MFRNPRARTCLNSALKNIGSRNISPWERLNERSSAKDVEPLPHDVTMLGIEHFEGFDLEAAYNKVDIGLAAGRIT